MILNLKPASIIAVGVILPVLASLATSLRFYSRYRLRISLKEDDFAFLVSVGLIWGLGITVVIGGALGALGGHSKQAAAHAYHHDTIVIGPKDHIAEKIMLGYSIIEKLAFGLIKISVLLSYRRVFPGKKFNIAALTMIGVLSLLTIAFVITSTFQCPTRNWSLTHAAWAKKKHCIQSEVSWSGFSISDVATDLIILLFPVIPVWKLQLTTSKKMSVILVSILGSLSTGIGIVRMVVILVFTYNSTAEYRDFLGAISTALVWSLAEASVAIIAASMPSIRPLIHRASDSRARSKSTSTTRSGRQLPRSQRMSSNNFHPLDGPRYPFNQDQDILDDAYTLESLNNIDSIENFDKQQTPRVVARAWA
ncbi:hypothetical protein N7495_003598 [Penicillium taxi]|uniref:uncharacterized protein n=1 Tax=Penicillium taxi TaxID=168475 RepID=UPI002545572A|nr:uncharacterized protein N7495_003598 [Penicillium taxi]KAJ5898854.1 hypothetical protein N7495_003598 [Penicillium taxi]